MRLPEMNPYIRFVDKGDSPSGKTKIWWVESVSSNKVLAAIKWFSAWRQYCFYPVADTIWNKECMLDVGTFLEKVNNEHAWLRKLGT